jgi:uncharacterized protein YqeY
MGMLKSRLQDDMKTAMKAGDKPRLGVIRLMLAAIKQREVDERIELDDAQTLAVLDKMVKQRRDSISQYEGAGREDLAEVERFEVGVIQGYLPAALSDAEIAALLEEAIAASGAAAMSDMGKVMNVLRPQIQGRADMGAVSAWSSSASEARPRRAYPAWPDIFPPEFIDQLLARTDIVELIGSRLQLRKAGREFQARCPFHDEKTPSFSVSPEKQFYHCFGCGAHGTAIGFLMEYDHLPFREAVEELAERAGLEIPNDGEPMQAAPDHGPLYRLMEDAALYYRRQLREHPEAQRAVAYLKERGLTGEIAARFGLGYAPARGNPVLTQFGADDAMCVPGSRRSGWSPNRTVGSTTNSAIASCSRSATGAGASSVSAGECSATASPSISIRPRHRSSTRVASSTDSTRPSAPIVRSTP